MQGVSWPRRGERRSKAPWNTRPPYTGAPKTTKSWEVNTCSGAGEVVTSSSWASPKAEAMAQAPRREVPVGEKAAQYSAISIHPFW